MPVRRGLAGVSAACGLFLLASVAGPIAADRDARVITPSGSPVLLDPLRALLLMPNRDEPFAALHSLADIGGF